MRSKTAAVLFCVTALLAPAEYRAQYTLFPDIPYDAIPGVDPNLLALDIYVPVGADGTNPVMMMYHGGSYTSGDKTVPGVVHPKMDYYTALGWVFLSVNYRLTDPSLPIDHPAQVTHPDHIEDVARSVAWTIENIPAYGGDPTTLVLVGFSAGAHLVALVATDESRLETEGHSPSDLDGVIALDGLYDIPLRYTQFPPPPPTNRLIWGFSAASQQDMSATLHVEPGECIPPMLVVHGDPANNEEQAVFFVDTLVLDGYEAEAFNVPGLTHPQIGESIGFVGHPLTIKADEFLAGLPALGGGPLGAGDVDGLRVERAGGDVVLRWGPSCVCTDSDYVVYEGALGDFTSHVPVTCSTGGAAEHGFTPQTGSRYFLAAPRSADREGSLGSDSAGTERGQGLGSCFARLTAVCDR